MIEMNNRVIAAFKQSNIFNYILIINPMIKIMGSLYMNVN